MSFVIVGDNIVNEANVTHVKEGDPMIVGAVDMLYFVNGESLAVDAGKWKSRRQESG